MSAVSVLRSLPEVAFDYTVPNDEDWNDGGIAYVDASANPAVLDGITVSITVRKALGDPSVLWYADSTGPYVLVLPVTMGGVNSAWCIYVPKASLSPFLPLNDGGLPYVYAVQGTVSGATATLASGNLTMIAGAA